TTRIPGSNQPMIKFEDVVSGNAPIKFSRLSQRKSGAFQVKVRAIFQLQHPLNEILNGIIIVERGRTPDLLQATIASGDYRTTLAHCFDDRQAKSFIMAWENQAKSSQVKSFEPFL